MRGGLRSWHGRRSRWVVQQLVSDFLGSKELNRNPAELEGIVIGKACERAREQWVDEISKMQKISEIKNFETKIFESENSGVKIFKVKGLNQVIIFIEAVARDTVAHGGTCTASAAVPASILTGQKSNKTNCLALLELFDLDTSIADPC